LRERKASVVKSSQGKGRRTGKPKPQLRPTLARRRKELNVRKMRYALRLKKQKRDNTGRGGAPVGKNAVNKRRKRSNRKKGELGLQSAKIHQSEKSKIVQAKGRKRD